MDFSNCKTKCSTHSSNAQITMPNLHQVDGWKKSSAPSSGFPLHSCSSTTTMRSASISLSSISPLSSALEQ